MESDAHTLPPLQSIRTAQQLLGHSGVSTTMIHTRLLELGGGAVRSPFDALRAALADAQRSHLDGSVGGVAPEPMPPPALAWAT